MTTSKIFPDVNDLAAQFNCNKSTIWRGVAKGTFPKPFKFGGLVRWDPDEVADVVDSAKRERDEAGAA
jgi:predicted DNA-binding transcriptional regulator AlpA